MTGAPSAPPPTPRRPSIARSARALGAVAAQFSQAGTSLLFALLGLRTLSAEEFALLGLLLGALVVATALMTGLVGDSLTVLERRDPRVRAALQGLCLVLSLVLLVVGTVTTWALDLLALGSAVLFGCGLAAFTLEDTGRRLLMANLRFWPVVAVDGVYAAVAAAVLALRAATTGDLRLADFLLALAVGQVVAFVAAVLLLPREERRWAPWRGAAVRLVLSFGAWRAAQQAVRPAALTLIRSILLATAGAVTLATFEASRVYVSPALLLVNGSGSFLLATNSVERDRSVPAALRAADRSAALLGAAGVVLGALLLLLLPWLGPVLTGGDDIEIGAASVASWSAVAVASGLAMPYSALATVRARPSRVIAARLLDTAVSLALVLVLVAVPAPTAALLPLALAVGALTSAGLQRRLVTTAPLATPAA